MNRERSKKLLNRTGLAVLKRPDGGVVTQRTANPLPSAHFRHSWQFSPSVPRTTFQGLRRSSANRARDAARRAETRMRLGCLSTGKPGGEAMRPIERTTP
jgi:hypothetical protein